MKVSYPNGVIVKLGEELTPTQVKKTPWVTWEAEENAFYTLIMVDPDAPSRENPTLRQVDDSELQISNICNQIFVDFFFLFIGSSLASYEYSRILCPKWR